MCTFLNNGVQFDDKTFISYSEDLGSISPEKIAELSENSATGWGMFLLHRSIEEIRGEIKTYLFHPVNTEKIQDMIDNSIKKQPKVFWKKSIDLFKDLTILITLAVLILSLLNVIHIK